jgi:hypothetical protein
MTRRENIEWCDLWVTDADDESRPRLLMIGDSITRAYFPFVETQLHERFACARLTTSRCLCDPWYLTELDRVLDEFRFAVIHLNNGLHGWDYTESEYEAALPKVMEHVRAKAAGAVLIWAQTTPVMVIDDKPHFAEQNQRVLERNRIAAAWASAHQVAVNNLYAVVADHPEYWIKDGFHFTATGSEALANQVAICITRAARTTATG